jgi:hypothetical protein
MEKVPPSLNKDELETRGGKKTFFEPDFALAKKETTGKYGKPATYWESFTVAINSKRAARIKKKLGEKAYEGYEITLDTMEFRIPNKDIFDQVNTMLKIAKKRSSVDVALSVGRLSDIFTQDIEEFIGQIEEEPPVTPGEGTEQPGNGPEDEPHKPAESAPISEETKNEVATLIAQSCMGGKRTTEKVLAQIRERVKFAFNRDLKKVPDDLTQDEAARVIVFLKALK